MKYLKTYFGCFLVYFLLAGLKIWPLSAGEIPHPDTYIPTYVDLEEHKRMYDDPRPYLTTFGPKQIIPPELYEKLTYDVEEMKDAWAETVGFRSPDLVGKIAPEIKPGKYRCQDKDKYPGLRELMWPDLYERVNQGGPPYAGNIPEFEIIPTRQYYWALPIAKATFENMERTRLDQDGYIEWDTWGGGYPFPRPSGSHKGQQIIYNIEKRYMNWGLNFYILGHSHGVTKDLKIDFEGKFFVKHCNLARRVMAAPSGWFDERANKREEIKGFLFGFTAPRDVQGVTQSAVYYLDPRRSDQLMMYIPSLRRVRKLSATDTQDPIMGTDCIYDDTDGFNQKLSPTRYPYTYEVLEEREYLVPAPTLDGSEYISSGGFEYRNLRFERRPLYVVKMTQLDRNYVYGHRVFYVDKETFAYSHVENYDQKGRLYRSLDINYGFFPDMGMISWCGALVLFRDHLDTHSTVQTYLQVPAFWNRDDLSLRGLVKMAK